MKKVLIITTISGFLPQFERNDVKILRELGCEIHYASNFKNPVYEFDETQLNSSGIITHHIDIAKSPIRLKSNIRAFRQIKRIIEENDIDMIHCHNPMGGVTGRIAAQTVKKKPYVIYTAHGFHFYKGAPLLNWLLYYPAERFLAHSTDQIITINSEDYRRVNSFLLRKGGCITQIHSVGVDRDRFRPDEAVGKRKRRELVIPENAFHIVTAAELNNNKNQKIIIEALALLGREDIYYSICGRGPAEGKLRSLILEKHLERQVHLLGFRTDMEEILQTADAFAFPSKREGLGVAAVEALLCGVPLIAADNRGTREYARDGENSIVCHSDDVEGFRHAIDTLYTDSRQRGEMRARCRKSAEKFTIPEVEKTMQSVYGAALQAIGGNP